MSTRIRSWPRAQAPILGVREVHDDLAVVFTGRRADAEIDSEVEFVGSAAERDRAHGLAASVPGARSVETEHLAVPWWARDEDLRSPAATKPTDRQIHEAIKAAALVDPRLKSCAVRPAVSGGLVTLTGG